MKQYLDLLKEIKDKGVRKEDRTGTGTISIFGHQMRFDLQEGFPLVTTKKVNFDSILHELLWFVRGDTNIEYLVKNKVNIWNEWPFKSWLEKTNQLQNIEMHSEEWKEKEMLYARKVMGMMDNEKVRTNKLKQWLYTQIHLPFQEVTIDLDL